MPNPRDVLKVLQSTLHIKNKKFNDMMEGDGLQAAQGFSSHYSNMGNTDIAADVPDTQHGDRQYQTTVTVGLPSSIIGDGVTAPEHAEDKNNSPRASKIFFAKEQSIPGLPPPPDETPRGIPPFLHGKIPGLPGLADTPTTAPAAPDVTPPPPPEMSALSAPQANTAPLPEMPAPPQGPSNVAAPPPMGPGDMAAPPPGGMPPMGPGGMAPPPGGMPPPPMGDPNMMAMGAPGAPVDIDPITGLPIRQPSEIGRIYELKKIYSRLTTIEAFLSDTTDQDLIEVRNVIAQAIEFFEIVTSNLQAYKDRLDEIIVMFYDFLDQAYSMMADFFKEKKERFDKDKKNKR
jgi:hypothetical protein